MAATAREASSDPRVEAGRVYIIDFDRSRRLPLKQGAQGPVILPDTICSPPSGITKLDPYSWDVYSRVAHLKNAALSDSLAKAKLSKSEQIFTNLLLEKKPELSPGVFPIPRSRKWLGLIRALGFGFNSFLKEGNKYEGIEPRDDGGGGG